MNLQKIVVPLVAVIGFVVAYRAWGWAGVALAAGALVMWVLLHFTRMMKVLQRAADRPLGYCDSAVMLNAKLKPKVPLLHVVAMTRAIGEQLGDKEAQTEVFRWTDPGGSHVTCEFVDGRLVQWSLYRPTQAEEAAGTGPSAPSAPAP